MFFDESFRIFSFLRSSLSSCFVFTCFREMSPDESVLVSRSIKGSCGKFCVNFLLCPSSAIINYLSIYRRIQTDLKLLFFASIDELVI